MSTATHGETQDTKLSSAPARGGRSWDAALLVSLAALAGGLSLAQRGATCLGAGVVFALVFRRVSHVAWLCAVLAFALSAWRAQLHVERFQAQRQEVRAALGAPARCVVSGRVVTSPMWRNDALDWIGELDHAECEGRVLPVPVRARLYGGPRSLARGDQFEAVAQLGIVRIFRNLDLPDPTLGMSRSNVVLSGSALALTVVEPDSRVTSRIDHFRDHVRGRIEATFSPPAVGMAKALVLGENDLTEEEDLAFRQSGLAHLLAVSGTHLVFAVVSLVMGLRFVLVRLPVLAERFHTERLATALGTVLALVYADFAGGSGSAWRAAWMLAAAFLTRTFDRRPNVARSIAASVLVGVALDPLAAFDLSFMLSLAATSGLVTLGQRWSRRFERVQYRPARLFAQGLSATLSSILPCSVLLALLSPALSLPGMVLNVLAAPFGEVVALPLCLSHTLLAPLPALEYGTALVASGALLVVKQAAFLSTWAVEQVPLLGIPLPLPTGGHVAVLAITAAWLLRPRLQGHVMQSAHWIGAWGTGAHWLCARWTPTVLVWGAAALALVCVEWQATRRGNPTGELRVSALDVGQGDATFIDFPDGTSMLIDAGGFVGSPVDPGERVVVPLLRARRKTRIDVVVLSHPHPDHFGGLLSVVRAAEIGEFWDTGQGQKEGALAPYAELISELKRRGVPIRGPSELCGSRALGGAEIDIVGPCPAVIPGRNANDNSWVFRVRHKNRAALFTGDAEEHQEKEILERSPELIKADLLKVGHHGSRTSTTPEFLAAVAPRWATISCGVRNRYGHPHAKTLHTLADQRVTALRLDDLGAVRWETDGEATRLLRYQSP